MPLTRRITFYAWANQLANAPFDRIAAAQNIQGIDRDDLVLEHDAGTLTAVEILEVGDDHEPTRLLLHKLHDESSSPSEWNPDDGSTPIEIGDDSFTAFSAHVSIWPDKTVAVDAHGEAPGLGRLATYILRKAEERVLFRALYRTDAAERLRDLDGVKAVELSIHSPSKLHQARQLGVIGSLLPQRDFPSVYVSVGMGKQRNHEPYLTDEAAVEINQIADIAEEYFDRICVRGKSRSILTHKGNRKTIEVNLLSERLAIELELGRDTEVPSLPNRQEVFRAMDLHRQRLLADNSLQTAVEARLAAG